MVRIGHFKNFLEMFLWLSYLVLEVSLDGHNILLAGVVRFLVIVIAVGGDYDPSGRCFCPFLPPSAPFRAPMTVALDGAAWLPPPVAFQSLRAKATPIASSPEAC
jgi:hypothetical protein